MPVLLKGKGKKKELIPGIEANIVSLGSLMTLLSEINFGIQKEPLPFHVHEAEQTTYILEGELTVFIEGEAPIRLKAGDMYCVASNIPHTIQSHSEIIRVVESFSPPRKEFL
ncbi:MAG: cupin domain-containing protein [Bacteroidales bacterium]|nr:cupin domain-containing protein [Bacteroidales bacterium]